MADIHINDNYLDFYSTNDDYTGSRQLKNEQEVVEFHNASTMRIWFNEQNINFPQHWHSAMEIIMPVENYYYRGAASMPAVRIPDSTRVVVDDLNERFYCSIRDIFRKPLLTKVVDEKNIPNNKENEINNYIIKIKKRS